MLDGLALLFIALSEIIRQANRSQEPGRVALEEPASENSSRTGPFLSLIGRHMSKILVVWLSCPRGDRNDSHHRLSLKYVLRHHPQLPCSLLVHRHMYSPGQATIRQDRRDNRPRTCIIQSMSAACGISYLLSTCPRFNSSITYQTSFFKTR